MSAPEPMVEIAVSLRDVTKHYSAGSTRVTAVNGISLDIRPGQFTTLMGPSGSGKTSALSIMGGILRPTGGEVLICGRSVSQADEIERSKVRLAHIGFVFQSYNLFPSLTAQQNVEIALDLKGVKGRDRAQRARTMLERVELGEKAGSYPGDLSGGQRQRVAIARALVGEPSLILADEPTAALDSTNGRRIIKLLRSLVDQENRAVVIVTHDSRIAEFADRTIHMQDGGITEDKEVAATPAAQEAANPYSWREAPADRLGNRPDDRQVGQHADRVIQKVVA